MHLVKEKKVNDMCIFVFIKKTINEFFVAPNIKSYNDKIKKLMRQQQAQYQP